LTTLTILEERLKLIAQTKGKTQPGQPAPHSPRWTKSHSKIRDLRKGLHRGLTSGVFQFESHGMRDVLRLYQPNSIETSPP